MRRQRATQEFERFVAEATDGLLRTGYLIVWDAAAAEDLVQECLFRISRRWPRVRSMDHPTAYARRVLVNLALDGEGRRRRHRRELEPQGRQHAPDRGDEAAVRAFVSVETTSALIDALGSLPPRQRAALALRYFDDLSEVEVAEAMGCSVGTVKSTTSRALDRLRHVLAPADEDDRQFDMHGSDTTKGARR